MLQLAYRKKLLIYNFFLRYMRINMKLKISVFFLLFYRWATVLGMPEQLKQILSIIYQNNVPFRKCIETEQICKCPYGLQCYVKPFNENRLSRYAKLEKLIEERKLDEVTLPQKFIWYNEQLPQKKCIVAEELEPQRTMINGSSKCLLDGISRKQFKQLMILMSNGFWDFRGMNKSFECGNVFLTTDHSHKKFWESNCDKELNKEKKIAIIDTKNFDNWHGYSKLYYGLASLFSQFNTCGIEHCPVNPRDLPEESLDEFWEEWKHCFKKPLD